MRPNLGHKNKFLLLLCQRKSEFGRYLRTYEKQEIEYSYRTGWQREGMFSAANIEAISENWKMENDAPIDTMFHCLIAHCIANNFVDGYEQNLYRSPAWIVYGLGHMYTKRIDQRWPFFDGRKVIYDKDDESWYWKPRVKNLVKNDFYASAEKMFGWKKYDDLGPRDHMVAWSKLEYLVTEAEGDPKKFLSLACSPLTSSRGNEVNPDNELVTRQTNALAEAFGMSPEELDKAWAKWVSKTYKKK